MIGTNTVLNDRYRLVSVLATGGMGVIWRGWDKRSQNVVAIKVLKEELIGQATFLARLRAEATNAARLHHPNLAAVFDWGETDGQGWIAMELVEGRPLSDILAGGHTMSWDELAPILIQTANGLQAAHEGRVIHRDVKPSNILVSDKGVAKLTDFGISLAPRAEALTAVGMVMGTAQYLPPEQAMGETATALGDIYALGVIAYEALAGKRPFTGPTQVDIAMAHVKDPVPPLPDTVNPQVAQLIYRMLEKDPRLRPQSAKILASEIQALWHGTVPLSYTPRMSFSRRLPDAPPTAEMPLPTAVNRPTTPEQVNQAAAPEATKPAAATVPPVASPVSPTPVTPPISPPDSIVPPVASPVSPAPVGPSAVPTSPAAPVSPQPNPAPVASKPPSVPPLTRPKLGGSTTSIADSHVQSQKPVTPPENPVRPVPVSNTTFVTENNTGKPGEPIPAAAIPVANSPIPEQRHQEMLRHLEAQPLPQPAANSRKKLIVALVIAAVVLVSLIFGLVTTLRSGATAGNLESRDIVFTMQAPVSSPAEEENLESV